MSLKFYITLFLTLFAALVVLLLIEDPEQVKNFVSNPPFVLGFSTLAAYSMIQSKKRYLTGLGGLLMLAVGIVSICFYLKLFVQFNEYLYSNNGISGTTKFLKECLMQW